MTGWGRFEMRNNVRTEGRGDREPVCFRKQDDSWVSSAARARKQQSWRATWLWGKGTGPGSHILPQSDLASWLVVAMRSLPRALARTPPDQGQRLGADRDDQGCPSPGYRGFLAPLCDRGRVIEEKSVEPEVGWSLSLQGGRGPRYLHPADGLCDRWLGAITL